MPLKVGDAESGDAAKEAIERKLGCVSGAAAPATDDNGSKAYPGRGGSPLALDPNQIKLGYAKIERQHIALTPTFS